jgi:hypothetical protein
MISKNQAKICWIVFIPSKSQNYASAIKYDRLAIPFGYPLNQIARHKVGCCWFNQNNPIYSTLSRGLFN